MICEYGDEFKFLVILYNIHIFEKKEKKIYNSFKERKQHEGGGVRGGGLDENSSSSSRTV